MSIIYLNVYTYIFLLFLFFSLLFLFNLSKVKTLSDIKIFNKKGFLSITAVLVFLSMAGIPPLAGFTGKFLIFNFLFFLQKYNFLLLFSVLNFFSIYFYVQNIRFLVGKSFTHDGFFFKSNFAFFNKNLINLVVLLNFFNFFGIVYAEEFLLYFLHLNFYKIA